MKKFKSLMLAALASAALAAPSFADGHEGPNVGITKVGGEIFFELQYNASDPDEGNSTVVNDAEIGDVNIKLSSDHYALEIEKDDEDADTNVNMEIFGRVESGDNFIYGFGEITDIAGDSAENGYGDVYITGGNKTFSMKVGQYTNTEYFGNGMGVSRAGLAGVGVDPDNVFEGGENLVIKDFHGIQLDVNAGDLGFELALPWMNSGDSSTYVLTSSKAQTVNGTAIAANDPVASNITGIRPGVTFSNGNVDVKAIFYSLSISAQNGDIDTLEKNRSAAQIVASLNAGAATIGAFYSTQNRTDGSTDVNPSAAGANVTVALGGGQKVGASFDTANNGIYGATEATSTRFSASYATPFFVEAVTMEAGVGTASQTSDTKSMAGGATSAELQWSYKF